LNTLLDCQTLHFLVDSFGAGEEVRTLDILLGKQVLYQLSYTRMCLVDRDRFELPTYAL
jgi:hypothetical protein